MAQLKLFHLQIIHQMNIKPSHKIYYGAIHLEEIKSKAKHQTEVHFYECSRLNDSNLLNSCLRKLNLKTSDKIKYRIVKIDLEKSRSCGFTAF